MKQKLLIIGDSAPSKNSETSSFDKIIMHSALRKIDTKIANYSAITDGEIPYIDGHCHILLLFPYSYWSQHIEKDEDGVLYGDERYGMLFDSYLDRVDNIIKAKYGSFKYINPPASIKADRDKRMTKTMLKNHGIRVPDEWCIQTPEDNLKMLHMEIKATKSFYIKPRFGAMGKGITYLSKRKIVSNYKNGEGLRSGFDYGWSFQKIGKKSQLLRQILQSNPVIEEEIKTPLIKNRKFDLRIYVVYGRVPYMYARTASVRKPITNWSQGGRIEKHSFLRHIPSGRLKEIKKIARKSAKILGLNFCGVDIIFDEKWNPYVLEAQSMPSWESGYDLFGTLINNISRRKNA